MKRVLLILLASLLPIYSAYAGVGTSIMSDGEVYNLHLYESEEHAGLIANFNRVIQDKKIPEEIRNCELIIDLPVGHAYGNHSYGGYCTSIVGKTYKHLMICTDDFMARLKIQQQDPNNKFEWLQKGMLNTLVKFVADHCYGG